MIASTVGLSADFVSAVQPSICASSVAPFFPLHKSTLLELEFCATAPVVTNISIRPDVTLCITQRDGSCPIPPIRCITPHFSAQGGRRTCCSAEHTVLPAMEPHRVRVFRQHCQRGSM